MADWIPVVSQIKSAVQAVFGDKKGAKQTQENFIRQCLVVSQITSLVQFLLGDEESARATQIVFLKTMGGLVDGVPVVGHIKGGVHYAFKDKEGGDAAMKAASHTSAAVAGGIGGFLIGGPPGAIAGGIAGGTMMDGIITASELGVSGEYKPEGIFRPLSDPKNPGKWVDGVTGIAIDGAVGHIAGSMTAKLTTSRMADISSPKARPNVENIQKLAKATEGVKAAVGSIAKAITKKNSSDPEKGPKRTKGTDGSTQTEEVDYSQETENMIANENTEANVRKLEEKQ